MSYWSNLAMRAGGRAIDAASSIRYRYSERPDGTLKYVSKSAYKFALAHWLKREVIAMAASEINQLFPKYQRSLEKKLRETAQEQQNEQIRWIIDDAVVIDKELGRLVLDDNKTTIYAKDAWGRTVPEAIFISYNGPDTIEGETITHNSNGAESRQTYSSHTVFVYDVCPKVTVNSGKNIVTTQVTGRDFTRKELVSGGDITFCVSGTLVTHYAALKSRKGDEFTDSAVQYPENDVKKFIQIMQYPGIINVNHYLFKQFNVKRIIIKDFSLKQAEYKNIQPYEFTCIAVEPDEDVVVKQDTINELNRELTLSPMSKWYKFILNNKLGEIAGNMATDIVGSATSLGLDSLTFGANI